MKKTIAMLLAAAMIRVRFFQQHLFYAGNDYQCDPDRSGGRS